MPRPRKTPEEVRAARQAAANARWSQLKTPAKRRAATANAVAASLRSRKRD
jgi:hypothetical protein